MLEQKNENAASGAIALVGSGEYLDAMNTTDAYLLGTLGEAATANVALLPTASGLEQLSPARWNALGRRHFRQLGVQDIRSTMIIDRASANDPEQLALLDGAHFYYLSGGDPQHTIATLRETAAWKMILQTHMQGAVLAGCSAGAMALGSYTIAMRQMMMGGQPTWEPSLGVLPGLVVFPHFDRMSGFISQSLLQQLLFALPEGVIALGIDENTAFVRMEVEVPYNASRPARWRVMGSQTVSVFERDGSRRVLQAGEEIVL